MKYLLLTLPLYIIICNILYGNALPITRTTYHPPRYITTTHTQFTDHSGLGQISTGYESRLHTSRRRNLRVFAPSVTDSRTYGSLPAASIQRKSFSYPLPGFGRALEAPESMWPVGVFIPPESVQDLGYSVNERGHVTPDFSNGLEHPDPYLITGKRAKAVVDYLFRKELFFEDYPHAEALLRNQEEREDNGLAGNYLSSTRPESPFIRF